MIRKIRKYLKVVHIDVLVYRMTKADAVQLPEIGFTVSETSENRKLKYSITEGDTVVHNSFVFPKLRVLQLLGKSGPAIGECVTNPDYRGKSIYPYVINLAARNELQKFPEVFIIVRPDNPASIKGIEKAGFRFHAHVLAKRFLFFYYNVRISHRFP